MHNAPAGVVKVFRYKRKIVKELIIQLPSVVGIKGKNGIHRRRTKKGTRN